MKTILLHVHDDPALSRRLQTALSLARAFSAHLSCLHVTPVEAYAAVGAFDGAVFISNVTEALEQGEMRMREQVESQLRTEDVSWDYQQITGSVAATIIRHAALADLLVTGREGHSIKARYTTQLGMLGDLLYRCRTPLFIPAAEGTADPTRPALIAWDGSYEAANAVRGAVPYLRLASQVTALTVDRVREEGFPSTRLLEYLSRHDIHAELVNEQGTREDTSRIIIGTALSMDAGTVVLGGYNHSRIGELIFGGVTRTLLSDSPLPLLMAH